MFQKGRKLLMNDSASYLGHWALAEAIHGYNQAWTNRVELCLCNPQGAIHTYVSASDLVLGPVKALGQVRSPVLLPAIPYR
jgi:hypothetical protein